MMNLLDPDLVPAVIAVLIAAMTAARLFRSRRLRPGGGAHDPVLLSAMAAAGPMPLIPGRGRA